MQMQKKQFSIFINAPKEKVWDTMLGEATYREWTTVFHEGSYFVGNWEKDSKMLFLGPEDKGDGEGGMVSIVRENRKNEFVSLEHVGMISNGVEDTTSDEVKKWTPAFENYSFVEKDGGTEVVVDIDINEEYQAMFEGIWPKALELLKTISERT